MFHPSVHIQIVQKFERSRANFCLEYNWWSLLICAYFLGWLFESKKQPKVDIHKKPKGRWLHWLDGWKSYSVNCCEKFVCELLKVRKLSWLFYCFYTLSECLCVCPLRSFGCSEVWESEMFRWNHSDLLFIIPEHTGRM